MKQLLALACVLRVLLAAAPAAAGLPGDADAVVADGKSAYQIVVPQQATPVERKAADELARYVRQMSGAALPVVDDTAPERKEEFLIGRTNRTARLLPGFDIAALEADSLEVRLTSSGGIKIRGGQVGTQQIRLTSSGEYDGGDLRSGSAQVELTSSGGATIWVTDQLEARLTSSGDLRYYGSPGLKVDVEETSSGDAKSLGDK